MVSWCPLVMALVAGCAGRFRPRGDHSRVIFENSAVAAPIGTRFQSAPLTDGTGVTVPDMQAGRMRYR